VADEAKSDIYSKISRSRQTVLVEFDRDPEEAMLRAIPGAGSVKKAKDRVWIIESQGEEDIRPAIFSFAVNNNLTVLSLQKQESNLEEVFRMLTGG